MEKKDILLLIVSLIALFFFIGIILYYIGKLDISRTPLLIAMRWLG